ncbi:hypothetical protein AFERRI_400101 [Acidithiobacillus ferrivorans]|uniref:Uncharacterized protein n=1 Tax=Acidithiobacillus ferrivorans TaxID=160808 RepID=A0A060UPF1_9PROT|nr:hypothetical protein AFERRI_400101 [Acidithiobacillus ferrivorans]
MCCAEWWIRRSCRCIDHRCRLQASQSCQIMGFFWYCAMFCKFSMVVTRACLTMPRELAFSANRAVPPGNRRQNLSDCANRRQHILATMHKFCAVIALQAKAFSGHLKAP